jgi:hypothetical protein
VSASRGGTSAEPHPEEQLEIREYLRVGRGGAVEESARKSSAPAMATSAEVGKAAAAVAGAGAGGMLPARGQVLVVGEEAVAAVAGVVLDFVGELRSLRCYRADLGGTSGAFFEF